MSRDRVYVGGFIQTRKRLVDKDVANKRGTDQPWECIAKLAIISDT